MHSTLSDEPNNYFRVLGRFYIFFDDRTAADRAQAWQQALDTLKRHGKPTAAIERYICIYRGYAEDDVGEVVSNRLVPIPVRLPVIGTAAAIRYTRSAA